MKKDPTEFNKRFKRWLNGEKVYDAGRALPGYEDGKKNVKGDSYTVGNLVNSIYANNPREQFLGEPEHHYDLTQSEQWANTHGYFPDERGHRDDRVKKPAHPSHPSRGTWNGNVFNLTETGIKNPNYTLFGLNDGGQDPQAVLKYKGSIVLPEITVTPKGNYIENTYDNIRLHLRPGYYMYQPRQERPSLQNDAIKVNYTPSVYLGDDETAQKLFRDRFNKEVNALYGIARFLPWAKYATDIADVRGISPDIDQPDFSDISGISAPLFDLMADKQRYDNLTNARIGRKINQFVHPKTKQFVSRGFSQNVIDGMNDQYQRTAGKWKTAKKLAPFRFVDLTSDIHQELVNLYKLKESIERESKYTERKASVDPQFKYKKK